MNKGLKYALIGAAVGLGLIIIFRKPLRRGVAEVVDYGLSKAQESYIQNLHPSVRDNFRKLIAEMKKKGYRFIPTSGFRSFKQQNDQHVANSKNAKAGYSYHNYGLALDGNIQRGTKIWLKKTSKEEWLQTGIPQMAEKMGFKWGGRFSNYFDPIHFDARHIVDKSTTKLLAMGKEQYGSIDRIKGNEIRIAA